jgi:hypothetical protein
MERVTVRRPVAPRDVIEMFRRPTSSGTSTLPARARHSRRERRREAVDTAARQARLDRVNRRLVEVGSVQVTRPQAIDTDTARRDPLTRPFSAPAPRVARSTAPFAVARSA